MVFNDSSPRVLIPSSFPPPRNAYISHQISMAFDGNICASIYSIQMSRVEPLGFQNTMVMPFCAPQVMEPVRIALEAKRSSQCKPSKHRW